MHRQIKLGLIGFFLISISFYSGYWTGKANNNLEFGDNQDNHPLILAPTSSVDQLFSEIDVEKPFKADTSKADQSDILPQSEGINVNTNKFDPEISVSTENDVIVLFEQLMAFSFPLQPEDYPKFGALENQIKKVLVNSSDEAEILSFYMLNFDPQTDEFIYSFSLINSLPETQLNQIIENLMPYVLGQNDPMHQTQFLTILSSNIALSENEETISALVDIASFEATSMDNRNRALDYLHPFQLDTSIRDELTTSLSESLKNGDEDINDKQDILNNILRFSVKQEKQTIALEYLQSQNETSLRYRILEGINSGSLDKTTELETVLNRIARDTEDPLQEEALSTLIQSFDITRREYQVLVDLKN